MDLKNESWAVKCPTIDPYDSIPEVITFLLELASNVNEDENGDEKDYDPYGYTNDMTDGMEGMFLGLDLDIEINYFEIEVDEDYIPEEFENIITYEEFLIHLKKEVIYEVY